MTGTRTRARRGNAILNVSLLGFGEHRDSVVSPLTILPEHLKTDARQSVYLIDGPSGKPNKKNHSGPDPMLGTYTFKHTYTGTGPISTYKTPKESISASDKTIEAGMHAAIVEVTSLVNKMRAAGKKPITLNLYGVGQSADLALMIADRLNSLYSHDEVTVNIFGIDPVVIQFRDGGHQARRIPDNVRNYYAVLMSDETREEFPSQDKTKIVVQNPSETKVRHYILSGGHDTGMYKPLKLKEDATDDDIGHPAVLQYEALRDFIADTHVRLKSVDSFPHTAINKAGDKMLCEYDDKRLDPRRRLLGYNQMLIHRKDYERGQSSSHGWMKREFRSNKEAYFFHGTDYFFDETHMRLFAQQYPLVFDYFFCEAQARDALEDGGLNSYSEKVKDELNRMAGRAGDQHVYSTLNAKFSPNDDLRMRLPNPQGIPISLKDLDGQKKALALWMAAQSAAAMVLSGDDNKISKKTVKLFLEEVRKIVASADAEDVKVEKIKNIIIETILHHHKHSNFICALSGLVSSDKINHRVADTLLESILSHPKTGGDTLYGLVYKCREDIEEITKRELIAPDTRSDLITARMGRLKYEIEQKVLVSPHRKDVLAALDGYYLYKKPNFKASDPMIKNIERYINRFEWFGVFEWFGLRDAELTRSKKDIARELKTVLLQLQSLGAGNDTRQIREVLHVALQAAKAARVKTNKGEGEFDKMIRASLSSIENFPSLEENPLQQQVNDAVTAFKRALADKYPNVNAKARDGHSLFKNRQHSAAPGAPHSDAPPPRRKPIRQ